MLDHEDILDMIRIDEELDRQREEKWAEERMREHRGYWNEPRQWSPTDWSKLHEESDCHSLIASQYIRVLGLKFTWGGYGDDFYIQHNGYKHYIGENRFLPPAGLLIEFVKCWAGSGDITERDIINFIELSMKYHSDNMSIERSCRNECIVKRVSYTAPLEYFYIEIKKINGGKDYLLTQRCLLNTDFSGDWSKYCKNKKNVSEIDVVKLSEIVAKDDPFSALNCFIRYGRI